MYKGNKARAAAAAGQIEEKITDKIQKNHDFINDNTKNLKMYETSEKNGFHNVGYQAEADLHSGD